MIRKILNTVVEQTHLPLPHAVSPFTSNETAHLGWLVDEAPCFPINAANISILNEPSQFYNQLILYSRIACERITLASLYLGNGGLETNLVKNICENPNFRDLKINILLDYSRGSRFTNNSRIMLMPLLEQGNKNCKLSLYHTPVLRGVLKKCVPNRWNELFGVQHMKLYIFDDTLIISGANLSNDYFTNRQDRYFVINDKRLCDFYDGLVNKVQRFSIKIDKYDRESLETDWNILPYKGNKRNFIQEARTSVKDHVKFYQMNNKKQIKESEHSNNE